MSGMKSARMLLLPAALLSARVTLLALLSATLNVSLSSSSSRSLLTIMSTVCSVSPGAKVMVPLAAS